MKKKNAISQWRRTKIIATLGPATEKPAIIESLIVQGVDVFRLNMSHGDHAQHRTLVSRIRRAAKKLNRHVAIMVDLCGPKIRVNRFEQGAIELVEGETVTITSRQVLGKNGLISSQYKRIHKDLKPGQRILLDDGNIELLVKKINQHDVSCKVIYGGLLSDHKGMNMPDSTLTVSAFTRKDKQDAELAIELDVDFIALSFVRSHKDINTLQRFLDKASSAIGIIAKIEKPEAVENINQIIEACYGIMIARGDLGIEMPTEQLPIIQRELIELARAREKPVIVATQMLESMMSNARPTRAEVSDVADAAILGADAAMLSGETACGKYPLQAVTAMDKILREIEQHQKHKNIFTRNSKNLRHGEFTVREAVARAALKLTSDLSLKGIIVPTSSGTTARIVAAVRPPAPCLGVCPDNRVNRRMALHWGVIPIQVPEPVTHDWQKLCQVINQQYHFSGRGDTVLLISGFNNDPGLNEPVIKILTT